MLLKVFPGRFDTVTSFRPFPALFPFRVYLGPWQATESNKFRPKIFHVIANVDSQGSTVCTFVKPGLLLVGNNNAAESCSFGSGGTPRAKRLTVKSRLDLVNDDIAIPHPGDMFRPGDGFRSRCIFVNRVRIVA